MTQLSALWDTTRMRLLVEIERGGSLSAAARAIGIGQPSASQHVRSLEAAAGQRLVERNGRGSRLTEAGRILAAHAAQALATLAAGERELGSLVGLQTGTIRVGASAGPGAFLLLNMLGSFRRECPGVTVEVEIAANEEILRRLLAGTVELALICVDEADERLAFQPFLTDEIVGVAKPGIVETVDGTIEPSELAEQTLVCREPGSDSRARIERELQRMDVSPGQVSELGSTEAVKRATREGLGFGFLSRFAVADEVARGELEAFRLRGQPLLERELSVTRLASRALAPAEMAFVATLTHCCAQQVAYAEACLAKSGVSRSRSDS